MGPQPRFQAPSPAGPQPGWCRSAFLADPVAPVSSPILEEVSVTDSIARDRLRTALSSDRLTSRADVN